MIPLDMRHLYEGMSPDCHLVFIYDAGHAITDERPEAFTE
jgi:hypothetical protein